MINAAPLLRCAIYTRAPETTAGRSLARQRAVCRAYINRQREAGWIALPDYYSDRPAPDTRRGLPALQRLLEEVEHRRIDRLVVDQLSCICKSARDLDHILMILDHGGCALVAARHRIDGATPVGRQVLVTTGAMAPLIDRPGAMRGRNAADQEKAVTALMRLRAVQATGARRTQAGSCTVARRIA